MPPWPTYVNDEMAVIFSILNYWPTANLLTDDLQWFTRIFTIIHKVIHNHLRSFTTFYNLLQSFTTIYNHLQDGSQSFTTVYKMIYNHLQPFTIIHNHSQLFTWQFTIITSPIYRTSSFKRVFLGVCLWFQRRWLPLSVSGVSVTSLFIDSFL